MTTPAAVSASSWTTDLIRALAIVAASALIGLSANHFSRRPVPLLASDGPGALPERAERITTQALSEEMKTRILLLIDVRGLDVYARAHAMGAVNAPASDFLLHYQRLNLASKFAAVDGTVLICKDDQCPAADRVAKTLAGMGVKNVRVLHGGWDAYSKSSLSIEKAP